LNGENSVYAPKLLLWQPGENLDMLVVENQSYENLAHRRSVFFVDKRYFVIVDEAKGTEKGDIEIHFQFAPGDAVLNAESFSAQTDFTDGWNVFVQTQNQNGLKMIEEKGQVSFEYTKKEPRPAFCFRLEKKESDEKISFITVVIPFEKAVPDIQVKDFFRLPNGINLTISEKGIEKEISYKLN
ncbi:MAG TPA: heparinase II/III family protein, partial [Draconibacterium sp.]|nr:heparinase II/III family protein [Draconibacterium sp.]